MMNHAVLDLAINESMRASFAELLEKSFAEEVSPASLCLGEVLSVERDGLLVDVGGKYEGFIPMKEIPNCDNQEQLDAFYSAGQTIECFTLRDDEDSLRYVLSLRKVNQFKQWDVLAEAKDSNETLEATIIGPTKGGMLASVLGMKGFIPSSQMRMNRNNEDMTGQVMAVKLLEVDRNRNKLILSHRVAMQEQRQQLRALTLTQLVEGSVVTGDVVKITDFGVFIDINGVDGLLPLSEITWRRIKHPSDVLALGQTITVQILTLDHERQRISLSLKRMEADPWTLVDERFSIGQVIDVPVSKCLASGVLVEMLPGVEAFCPYGEQGKAFYVVNDNYSFEVVSIHAEERRLTLRLANNQG
jgi:ribosomal protein S1